MIVGRFASSVVITDDGKYTPIGYEDQKRVLDAMNKGEATVQVSRVGYYGGREGSVWLSVPRILRIEENTDRGRF